MKIWGIKMLKKEKRLLPLLLSLCLLLSGCSLLERDWSDVRPHSAAYWENKDTDTLRAENYQDLVNALLLLVGDHADSGTVRIYGMETAEREGMAERACGEVQNETAIGAYLLDYIAFSESSEEEFCEVRVTFGYRRTQEEQGALLHATTDEAVPDLLRTAAEGEKGSIAVQISDFSLGEEGFLAEVDAVRRECGAPEPWAVTFYPDAAAPGIVEIELVR